MSYKIKTVPNFDRQAKQIAKKHKGLKMDLAKLINQLYKNPTQGIHLGNHLYKIRMAISGTNQGKSGGSRIITCVVAVTETVYLTEIYLKSEHDSVDINKIIKLLKSSGIDIP